MGKLSEMLRAVERSVAKLTGGQSKALAGRKGFETKIRHVAAQAEPDIIQHLVKSGSAGWVNNPDRNDAMLVERDTGCVLKDSRGQEIRGPRVALIPSPPLDKGAFFQHLKLVEGFAPHMYKDTNENVTVGIGILLPDSEAAKELPFFVRGTGERAHPRHIENAFNKVRNSKIGGRAGANAFRSLTNIEISEAEAAVRALDAVDDFLRQLSSTSFFPEFAAYPTSAQTAILDMAYTLGPTGARDKFKRFTGAARRRNWKLAAIESIRTDVGPGRNAITRQWLNAAAQQEHFFIHASCTKAIKLELQ